MSGTQPSRLLARFRAPLEAYAAAVRPHDAHRIEATVGRWIDAIGAAWSDDEMRAASAGAGLPLRKWILREALRHAAEAREAIASPTPPRVGCGACGEGGCVGSGGGCASSQPSADGGLDPAALELFEHTWAREAIRETLASVACELDGSRSGGAWRVFERQQIEGATSRSIAVELGCTVTEVRAQVARVSERLDAALRRRLEEEGISDEAADDAVAWLLEASRR